MADYKYFTEEEFNTLVPSCSLSDMDKEFMSRLDCARHLAGFPFVLNCAYRSKEWDTAPERGRSGNSYHCKGQAVDIRCGDSKKRALIILACFRCGLFGIGVYPNFIHVDMRKEPLMFIGQKDKDQ